MFKISRGLSPNTYKIECFAYIREANFYTFLYSMDNIAQEEVVYALQGRVSNSESDEAYWATDIARLTGSCAIVGEDGKLKPIPVATRKDNLYGEYREGNG